MEADDRGGGRLCFGVFELDLRAGELRKRGLRIRLQQQPFQVLALLLERAGQVVGREELQKALWPADTFVDFDHGLNKAVNKVREALGDSAESPRYVETVGRRGYRFIVEVKAADGALVPQTRAATEPQLAAPTRDVADSAPTGRRPLRRLAWIAVLLLLAVVAVVRWNVSTHNTTPSTQIRSVAVLPFESLSNDSSQDYFADGMTD